MTAYGIGPEAELRDCHGEVGERVASSGRERGVWSGKSGEMLRSFFGGSFAGLCQTTILIPSDIIKIKLQVGALRIYGMVGPGATLKLCE